MNSKFRQAALVALGEGIVTVAMFGLFFLADRLDLGVLLGGIAGGALATANFFFLTLFANLAADKAEKQDTAAGQKLIRLSYSGRMAVLLLLLVLFAEAGLHPLALVIPLLAERPILLIAQRLGRRKGGMEQWS